MNYGRGIKRLCNKLDITQRQLAIDMKMSQPNLSRIFTGRTSPTMGTMERIAKAMDVPVFLIVIYSYATPGEAVAACRGRWGLSYSTTLSFLKTLAKTIT